MRCPLCLEPQEGAVLGVCCNVKFGAPWAIAALGAVEPRFVVLAGDGRRVAQVDADAVPFWDGAMFTLFDTLDGARAAQGVMGGEVVALAEWLGQTSLLSKGPPDGMVDPDGQDGLDGQDD